MDKQSARRYTHNMGKQEIKCPRCELNESQWKIGVTRAGSQRYKCGVCGKSYTPVHKKWVYTEDERKQAMRLLTDGNNGRAVGRAMNMSKANAYRWAAEAAKKGEAVCG